MPNKAAKKLLRMSDLVEKTGVHRQTIHFYINKGLLPRPLKTRKNMAYYEESYVERINLIKELQTKRFLPLSVIRELFTQTDGKLSPSELDAIKLGGEGLIQWEEIHREREPETLAALSERTGVPQEEIEDMEQWEMISSTQDENGAKIYRDSDIRIVEDVARIRKGGLTKERGFDVEEFRLHVNFINMLAVEEVKLFARKFGTQFSEDAPELLPKIAENAVENLNSLICNLRRRKILEAVKRFSEDGELDAAPTDEKEKVKSKQQPKKQRRSQRTRRRTLKRN